MGKNKKSVKTIMKRIMVPAAVLAASLTLLTGCGGGKKDAVTSVSKNFYEKDSFDEARLLEAIKNMEGAVTIATTNPDGSPNLSVAVPGAYSGYIAFAWAPNATKDNLLREGKAVVCCYVYHPDQESKYSGARVKVSPLTDKATLDKIASENPELKMESMNFLKIEELMPLG